MLIQLSDSLGGERGSRRGSHSIPFVLAFFLFLAWISLSLQRASYSYVPPHSSHTDIRANLVRFGVSEVAKDKRGWIFDPIALALASGISVMSTLALLFSFMQPWHDLHCKIEGRAAYDILTSFEQRWRKATKWSEMGRKLKRVSNWNDDSLIKIERISWILSPSELTPVDDPKLWVSKEDDPENWHVQVFRSIDYGSLKGFPKDVVVAKTQPYIEDNEVMKGRDGDGWEEEKKRRDSRHPHCPTLISILSETARWNPQNPLSKKSRRKAYTVVGTVGQRKPYTALGIVVGAQRSKLSTLPVNKLIVLYVVFKLDESYTLSKVSIHAGDGFHNLKEIKTVELMKPTGWVYLSLSGADPS
ncbi:Phospholipase D delta [Glycine max]|nr:Phospholipase D delta [Glycine max]